MHGATNAAIMAAAIVVCIVVIIAALITVTEVEKDIDRQCKKGSMTSVYGKSFTTLPHGSLNSSALNRAAVSGPPFQFAGSQVAGASFSHL